MEFDVIWEKCVSDEWSLIGDSVFFANHGNGFDDTFGENHTGATFDRIMFATKPIVVADHYGEKARRYLYMGMHSIDW